MRSLTPHIGTASMDFVPTAAYYTLGCKVNQYETEKIRQEMEAYGFDTVAFSAVADVYVINTCTVTSIADGKSRRAIRQAIKRNTDSLIVVTGCYAELEAGIVASIPGVDIVAPNAEKGEIARRAAARFPNLKPNPTTPHLPRMRTRAILKVQDGCDQFCAYCAVPYVRPGKRSRDYDEVIREAETLADFGYKEIVLTGIRLGSYCNGLVDVADLAKRIAEIDGVEHVRLSSIEVWEITDKLISAMASDECICPHLHVPLQSGDDETLQRMGRPYDSETFRRIIEGARSRIPDLAVTADVMVGFPGETDESFERSLVFVESVGFSRLHVFRYSPRPRTRALELGSKVPEQVKDRRGSLMIELGARLAQDYALRYVGWQVKVLAERGKSGSGKLAGYTGNYIEVDFDGSSDLAGALVEVEAKEAVEGRLIGRIPIHEKRPGSHSERSEESTH